MVLPVEESVYEDIVSVFMFLTLIPPVQWLPPIAPWRSNPIGPLNSLRIGGWGGRHSPCRLAHLVLTRNVLGQTEGIYRTLTCCKMINSNTISIFHEICPHFYCIRIYDFIIFLNTWPWRIRKICKYGILTEKISISIFSYPNNAFCS